MATNRSGFYITDESQALLARYHQHHFDKLGSDWDFREQMRVIDLAYLREQDMTVEHARARTANTLGNSNRIQNVTVPVIKPQVQAGVAYQTAVFLSDYPLFGVVSDPQYIEAAKQFQATIEDNSVRGAWGANIIQYFYDGYKYERSALEVDWAKITTAAVETDLEYKGGQEGKPVEIVWEGNCMKRWDMYNTYFDTSVRMENIPSQGEYAGNTELISRIALKMWLMNNPEHIKNNVIKAFESPSRLNIFAGAGNGPGFYIPKLNNDLYMNPQEVATNEVDWGSYLGLASNVNGQRVNYRGLYEISTEYVRIIPSEFKLNVPQPNTPQIWKLYYINHSVLIKAERQTNAHEKLPVFFGQPGLDGLGYQTKSLATDGMPFQQVASAIMNSILSARRRAITDRALYDPSRVTEAHMNNPNPSAKIPVRPQAYGKPVSEAVYQFPFRDDQSQMGFSEISQLLGMANLLNGQNQARQGQFVKGNKTDGQWESTMSNATSGDQLAAIKYEAQVFTPVKEILKINTMQYQGKATIYSPSQEKNVTIDPIVLRQAVTSFKVTDGLTPKEKVMSSESRKVAMQVLGSSPNLGAVYNIAPLFSYVMRLENVNLTPFEKSPPQVAYEQASNQWSQMAQLAIQKGTPFTTPQPKPQEYGYDPNMNNPANQVPTLPNNVQAQQQAV